jgi:hypothetical protein
MKDIRQHIKNVLIEENQNNKLEMVKQLIYELFDEVSFIEQSTYNDRPLLKIYFDSDDTAANIESWFDEHISNKILEYTADNIIVCPTWKPYWDWRKKNADVYIDTILLKYDNLGNIINEDYSPAGKEVTPNEIVVHKSNPMFRDKIMSQGLKARAGECYKIYVGYGEKCIPAIFATNSTNKRAWFDSTHDDDIWFIDTTKIPDVKWFKDKHFESRSKHIVTFQNIPKEAITLKYEGTGSGDVKTWDKKSPNLFESIRRILKEKTEDTDGSSNENDYEIKKNLKAIEKIIKMIDVEGLCEMWVTYNPVDNDYEIRSKTSIRYFDMEAMAQELEFIENSIHYLGLRINIFSPYYVENCDDEIAYMD